MPSPTYKIVTRFPLMAAAEVARAALESAGIPAILEGEEANQMLSGLASGIRGVKLLVREEDLQAAKDLIIEQLESTGPDHDWKCPSCGETVDAGFDKCWACGSSERTSSSA